ncbi:MAG TPA: GNAT family N-acetyltransferase [Jatrophihabitans sp.]|nr:GNAT family N-acetyltransferase [Jatrophihabitans sp.]
MTRSARCVAPGAPIVDIRAADPADYDAVRGLLAAAYAPYAAALPPDVYARYQRDLADVEGRARTGLVLVAKAGDELVGTATYYPDAGRGGMGWPAGCAAVRAVAVSPACSSRGIGRQLMRRCEQLARAAGAHSLCLHTAQFMTAATALYSRLGYVRAPQDDFDVTHVYALDGQPPLIVFGYRLDLHRTEKSA